MASPSSPAHRSPNGPGDGRPSAKQIIQDEGLEGRLAGKSVLITGCSSGIGVETAQALFITGATLYLTARNLDKAKETLSNLAKSNRVHFLGLSLDSLESVSWATPEGHTKDGFETQLGTNYLGHFLLFNLLQPALLAAATHGQSSRVVVLSSAAHRWGVFDPSNVNFEGNYDPIVAYGASKTANLWMANEIERRYGASDIHAWSVHPGFVQTDLGRHMSSDQQGATMADPYLASILKNPEQGASTSIWAAVASTLDGKGGKYLEDCSIAEAWDPSTPQSNPGYGTHAYDVEKAIKCWEKSVELVGIWDHS